MPVVQFHGRVHPTSVPLSINDITLDLEHPHIGKMKVLIRIQDSVIDVSCTPYAAEHAQLLFYQTLHLAQAAADLAGFVVGAGFQVIFEEATVDNQPRGWIEYRQPYLETLVSSISNSGREHFRATYDNSFNQVFFALCDHPTLLFALHDLNLALTHKVHQPTHCARAIESLRRYFDPSDRKKGWALLRNALNVSEDYLKFITNLSQEPRHGAIIDVNASDSREILVRTWTVANRFLEYLRAQSSGQALPAFPPL
jgi:hypothetical protein